MIASNIPNGIQTVKEWGLLLPGFLFVKVVYNQNIDFTIQGGTIASLLTMPRRRNQNISGG
jgi:hypothetical protein